MKKSLPDLNYIKSILDYNPDSGVFTWKVRRQGIKIGQSAGTLWIDKRNPDSKYYQIAINRKLYRLHRLAYFYVSSIDPMENQIDHADGDTLNNKFENLRLATHADNKKNQKKYKNNTSGFKGVNWDKKTKKWRARITVNNKKISLGYYNNKFYAALVYARAAKHYFGEFRREG